MASVKLSIEAHLCGPLSVGTVDVIKEVQRVAGLTLAEAKALIDRCVFEGETVTIGGLSADSALHSSRTSVHCLTRAAQRSAGIALHVQADIFDAARSEYRAVSFLLRRSWARFHGGTT